MLAFSVGYLSLSQEILWVRIVAFAELGMPQAFAFVLAVFLFGVASGATAGKWLCTRWPRTSDLAIGYALVLGGILDLLIPKAVALASSDGMLLSAMGWLIVGSAALKAMAFPVAHHLGSDHSGPRLGRSVSIVYALNIVGSTAGTLLTGYLILDYVSVTAAFMLIGATTIAIGLIALRRNYPASAWAAPVVLLVTLMTTDFADHALVLALGSHGAAPIKRIIENRHGIIHTVDGGRGGDDAVYGGNAYDGRTNLDLRVNSNLVDRVYLLAGLHPRPRRILMVGLGSGAWARILMEIPTLQSMTIVEINPGYLSLIADYPDLSPLLRDHRVHINIDDGRRWLRRNPDQRFDLIVMNTTWHWRANVTNLLSREFMVIARSHLAPGGIFAFNSTSSPDALATAAAVFPHAYRWSNFIYAAEHDFRGMMPLVPERLAGMRRPNGPPVFDLQQDANLKAIDALLARPFVSVSEVAAETGRSLEVISDANMITEFKFGREMRFF